MLFPPVLLFSSYLNLSGYKSDAAGITAAWSGLYALLAMRRSQVTLHVLTLCGAIRTKHEQGLKNKFTVRGVVRGGSLALCAVNVVGCGLAYTFGKREKEEKKA
jgi:hypothetical protein